MSWANHNADQQVQPFMVEVIDSGTPEKTEPCLTTMRNVLAYKGSTDLFPDRRSNLPKLQ
jgi:hypothetical protein